MSRAKGCLLTRASSVSIPDRLQATGRLHSTDYHFVAYFGSHQVVKLIDVFPYASGFVLVFEYMLSDLSEVLCNSTRPLT